MKNGDNTVNIQGRIMLLGFCPSPHYHLSIYDVPSLVKMSTVAIKLFAVQGTRLTDGQSGNYNYDFPFGEHKNPRCPNCPLVW